MVEHSEGEHCSGRVRSAHQRRWSENILNESRIEEAVEMFCQNEYWSGFYSQSPSAACKRRVALAFYYSMLHDDAGFEQREYKSEVERLESQFGLEDWKHMLKYSGHNPLRAEYMSKIGRIEGE